MRATRTALAGLAAVAWLALTGAAPVADEAAARQRIEQLARRILAANVADCARRQSDHGFTVGQVQTHPGGVPVLAVEAGGPAGTAGLRPGDTIRAINAVPWSTDRAELAAFLGSVARIGDRAVLDLAIERGGWPIHLRLVGRAMCRGTAVLVPGPKVGASAVGETIMVHAGLERLLPDDAELAFAVAHEAAHLVLGHTAPDQRAAIGDPVRRREMEQAADATALRLMWRAGYPPAAAASAWPKIADASRAPLRRLLDIYGPYLSTDQRTAFLQQQADSLTARSSPGAGRAR